MIWFLTFGKNGSAGMPAVPATILMSVSRLSILYKGWNKKNLTKLAAQILLNFSD